MNKELTAVNWLIENLATEKLGSKLHFEIIEEAKQMEQNQLNQKYEEGYDMGMHEAVRNN